MGAMYVYSNVTRFANRINSSSCSTNVVRRHGCHAFWKCGEKVCCNQSSLIRERIGEFEVRVSGIYIIPDFCWTPVDLPMSTVCEALIESLTSMELTVPFASLATELILCCHERNPIFWSWRKSPVYILGSYSGDIVVFAARANPTL